MKICLKPISVNDAWKGRRMSTDEKKVYELRLRSFLEGFELEDKNPPFLIHFRFHIGQGRDYDNCIKVTQDTICKHFGINDKHIHIAVVEKIVVEIGEEFFEFEIESISKKEFYFGLKPV